VVGVKPTGGGTAVAEMVATGDAICRVAVGVAEPTTGAGVSTWTLNVHPEINETITMRKATVFFIANLPRGYPYTVYSLSIP